MVKAKQPELLLQASHLVVEGGSGQDHGDLVGPLRLVLPLPHLVVPEVQPARVAHQPVGELPPHLGNKQETQVRER